MSRQPTERGGKPFDNEVVRVIRKGHRPGRPRHPIFRRGNQYPDQVVGVLGRLLDWAADFADVANLTQHLTKKEPGELKYLQLAVAEIQAVGREVTAKHVLRVMADIKAVEFYQRDKDAVLRGLNGNGGSAAGDDPRHALILPIPPHRFHLLEDISLEMLYVLPGHDVPHELDDYEVAELPTRSRTIKAELAAVQSVTFEGFIDRGDKVLTRCEITDLLADLADNGVKPLLRVVAMPHLPHDERFEAIEGGYELETFA